ncbi:MAG: hypothetical protein IPK28_10170 [Devosia sp.]|nr:hypothetical protein [Devosia sp.]
MANLAQALAADDLPALTDRIAAAADGLAPPRDAIEGAFVSIGDRLSACAAILGRLTRTFEALPAELESTELAEATDRLAIVGRRALAISAELGAEQETLSRMAQVVAAAGHPIAELRRTVKMTGIVAVNARVVAASVVSERDDFSVFTTDIAELSGSAAETVTDFARVYGMLCRVVTEAATARSNFEAAHCDALTALAQDLERGLGSVNAQRARSLAASADTGRMSRAIAERVAEIVMALQVGDATRQRVEHVAMALGELGGAEDDLVASIAELQHRQLVAARETLVEEMAAGEAALSQLCRDTETVLEHTRAVHGAAAGSSGLVPLHAALREAVALLADCEAERNKLAQVAGAVADTVRVLLGHVEAVQEIEYKMRLLSLNAAVKCAQLGPRGRALDVISQQLRALTGETVVSAHGAVEQLTEAARFAAAFTSSTVEGAAGGVGELEREATAALTLFSTVSDRLRQALDELRRDGPIVARQLAEAMDDLGRHAALSEALSDAEIAVAELAACAPPTAPAGEVATSLLSALRRRYTMDQERRLHDAFTGIDHAQTEPRGDSTGDIDDLLF